MGFIKIGDPMPINGALEPKDGSTIKCPQCDLPMTVVSIKEDDSLELICKCKQDLLEYTE